MDSKVIKHLPFEDGDIIRVFGNNAEQDGDIEIFEELSSCEGCFGIDQEKTCGAFMLRDESNVKIGLCWTHILSGYEKIEIVQQERNYVMVWQRSMNSGVFDYGKTTLKHVIKSAYKKNFVKTTIIEGKIVEEFGEQG